MATYLGWSHNPDNLKSGVTKACRYDPDINREYHEMASHYGCAIIPTRVASPKDKAHAENGVLVAQRWILAALRNHRFFTLRDLNKAISELLIQLNQKPFQKIPGTRRSLFEELDQPALRPLPIEPYIYADWDTTRVNTDYHVLVNNHYYSVPYTLADQKVDIRYTRNTVEIFHNNRRVASHLRDDAPRESTTLKEHMPAKHRKYLEMTPETILKRAQDIGESVVQVIHRLVEERQHPAQIYRAAAGIVYLTKGYSHERLEAACKRALEIDGCSYKSIKSILKNGLDLQDPQPSQSTPLIHHHNIRGNRYYLNDNHPEEGDFLC